ncbi:hypothetical protein [Gordonia sp. MMO-8]|uniref:hypothetical protein n=1 Tax=Gordonia sp. MMO-8 TaxID=3127886 RepID=UPI003015F679
MNARILTATLVAILAAGLSTGTAAADTDTTASLNDSQVVHTFGDTDPVETGRGYVSPGVARCPSEGAVSNSWTRTGTDETGAPTYAWVCHYADINQPDELSN